MTKQWHAETEAKVLETLGTNRGGLSSEEAEKRLAKYGPNKLEEKGGVHPFAIFLGQFKDIFVLMLLAAIVISFLVTLNEATAPTLENSPASALGQAQQAIP